MMKHHHLDLSEDEFLLFQQGDERVFHAVFSRYYDQIHRYVRSMTHEQQEIDDIVQQCFIQLFKYKSSIQQSAGLYPYLFVIARRLVITSFRRRVLETKFQDESSLTTDLACFKTQKQIEYNELESLLVQIIDLLPPRQREIYKLNKLDGYSYDEIAAVTGCSKNTIKNHLISASKTVRNLISRHYLIYLSFFLFAN